MKIKVSSLKDIADLFCHLDGVGIPTVKRSSVSFIGMVDYTDCDGSDMREFPIKLKGRRAVGQFRRFMKDRGIDATEATDLLVMGDVRF